MTSPVRCLVRWRLECLFDITYTVVACRTVKIQRNHQYLSRFLFLNSRWPKTVNGEEVINHLGQFDLKVMGFFSLVIAIMMVCLSYLLTHYHYPSSKRSCHDNCHRMEKIQPLSKQLISVSINMTLERVLSFASPSPAHPKDEMTRLILEPQYYLLSLFLVIAKSNRQQTYQNSLFMFRQPLLI